MGKKVKAKNKTVNEIINHKLRLFKAHFIKIDSFKPYSYMKQFSYSSK